MFIEVLTINGEIEIRDIDIKAVYFDNNQGCSYPYIDAYQHIIHLEKEVIGCDYYPYFSNIEHGIAFSYENDTLTVYALDLKREFGVREINIYATEIYIFKKDFIDSYRRHNVLDLLSNDYGNRFNAIVNISSYVNYINFTQIDFTQALKSIYEIDYIILPLGQIFYLSSSSNNNYEVLFRIGDDIIYSDFKWELPTDSIKETIKYINSIVSYNICQIEPYADESIVRFFRYDLKHNLIEFARILIGKNKNILYYKSIGGWLELDLKEESDRIISKVNKNTFDLKACILAEGLENTTFQYYQNYYQKYCNKSPYEYLFFYLLIYSGLENIFSWEKGKKIAEILTNNRACNVGYGFSKGMCHIFGEFNPYEKSFYKMVGIQNYMLRIILEADDETIKYIMDNCFFKKLKNKLGYQYFYHMDENTFRMIYELYITHTNCNFIMNTLFCLIENYGVNNIRNYIEKIYKYIEFYGKKDIFELMNVFISYDDYIVTARELRKHGINSFSWSIPTERIEEYHDRALSMYITINNQNKIAMVEESFNIQKKKWEKYKFIKQDYSILPPESPMEIILEGDILHHCVGTYLDKIANGETIVLFVRRTEEPDKPFYTLEIRNNEVRQCHGFANCDMTEDIKIVVDEFCEANNIGLIDKNSCLPA